MNTYKPSHTNSTAPDDLEPPEAESTTYTLSPGTTIRAWNDGEPLKFDVSALRGWRMKSARKGPRHMKPKRTK